MSAAFERKQGFFLALIIANTGYKLRNADEIDVYYWAEIFREDKEGKPSIASYTRLFLTQDSRKSLS
mgnify:CR=1 FL=1